MAKVILYNQDGKSVGDLVLPAHLFAVKANPALVHEAMIAQQANSRIAIAHTKDRSDVAGTGAKPWKQKGTGRARHGSRRSPIWIGGGVTFGPRSDRNFAKKLNRSARRKALAMVLTDKLESEKFVAVDTLMLAEAKTKHLIAVLKNLPSAGKKTLVVIDEKEKSLVRASRNLPRIEAIGAASLNIVDLMAHDFVLASKAAIETMERTFKR